MSGHRKFGPASSSLPPSVEAGPVFPASEQSPDWTHPLRRLSSALKARGFSSADQIAFVLIMVLAAVLRFRALGTQPLWLDEGYSWWDSRQSLLDLWRLVPQCDPHPPLYFAMLKGWSGAFGDSAFALRTLSATLGVLTTAVVFLAGREMSARTGWIAGLVFALTPFQIEFAHEARPYTLFCLGGALVAYGALRLLRQRDAGPGGSAPAVAAMPLGSLGRFAWPVLASPDRGAWAAMVVGCVLALWANNTAVLLVASLAVGLGLLLLIDRRANPLWRPALLVFCLIGLLWLPYLPLLFEQARGVSSDFWIQRPLGWRFANELRFVVSMSNFDATWWAVAALGIGLVMLWRRGAWRQAVMLGALAILPVALNYAISMTVKPIFIGRALIAAAPAITLVLASAIALIDTRWLRRSALVMFVAAHALAIVAMYENDRGKEPWDRIAAALTDARTQTQDGDAVVLLAPNELALPLSHALEELHRKVALRGAPANFPSPGMTARYPSGKCAPSVAGQDMGRIAGMVRGRRTVYFITRRDNVYDPNNGISRFLLSQGMTHAGTARYMPGFLEVHKFVANAVRRTATVVNAPALPRVPAPAPAWRMDIIHP